MGSRSTGGRSTHSLGIKPSDVGACGCARALASWSSSVVVGAEKMKRDVGLVSDDPAVVGIGRNVKELTGVKWDHAAVIKCGRCGARENQTDVLDVATSRAECGADVL